MLNSLFKKLKKGFLVTSSAWTKARKKLSHTAFIELNEKAIVEVVYEEEHERFKGFKLKAVDGTTVHLPDSQEIYEKFGTLETGNQNKDVKGRYSCSKVSVLYDVLNFIGVNSVMGKCDASEREQLLGQHLSLLQKDDLLLLDRGYPSYLVFSQLLQKCEFVARCSSASFKAAQDLLTLETSEDTSIITTLKAHSSVICEVRKLGLPEQIQIRFVKVHKPNGKCYVLATSLLDEERYPNEDFLALYDLRWNIETFFDVVKNRLSLENFTGKTVDAVYQDFFSTILITGLETILTDDAQDLLDHKEDIKQPQVVNKSISFSAIKDHVFELFYFERDGDELLEELTHIFLTRPRSLQLGRFVLRKKRFNYRQITKFYKRSKKYPF